MGVEGNLHFDIFCAHDKVKDVSIHSSRPLTATRIFIDKTIDEILRTVPLLYHVCGVAQSCAAVMACEQAMGIETAAQTVYARRILVLMETVREHLWRILLDWAGKLGESKDEKSVARLQQYLPQLKNAVSFNYSDSSSATSSDSPGGNIFTPGVTARLDASALRDIIAGIKSIVEERVFAMPLEKWLCIINEDELQRWQLENDTIASRMLQNIMKTEMVTTPDSGSHMPDRCFLPVLDQNNLHQCLRSHDAEDFIARPRWLGRTCETSSLSRQQNHPLVARLLATRGHGVSTRTVARLVELAGLPGECEQLMTKLFSSRYREKAPSVKRHTGTGIAQVEAARGRLVHRVELKGGRVQRYQILAPTEWNFHPQGVAAGLLKTLPATDKSSLMERADLLIHSIDPCVSYELELH